MGIVLPIPLSPYEELQNAPGEPITIDVWAKHIVISTNNQYLLPFYNQWVGNPSRCDFIETPCGGLKNSLISDMCPGSMSIEGTGCYLQNKIGTYINKSISAGKLSENTEIRTSKSEGIAYCTSDEVEYVTADEVRYLIYPPNNIVNEFKVINVTGITQTYTITVLCPDKVSSLKLYNIDKCVYEPTVFTNVIQPSGTVNSYTFTRTIAAYKTETLQVMVEYADLSYTFKFINDASKVNGVHNLDSWIAYYTLDKIEFLVFSQVPEYITCVRNNTGIVASITIATKGTISHGSITYDNLLNHISDANGLLDCFNGNIPGSLVKFLNTFNATPVHAKSSTNITTYVVPAISDVKIFPNSVISDDLKSSTISISASTGEFTCSSFVIKSDKACKLDFVVSDLTNGTHTLSKNYIDLKYIKCWYQAGFENKNTHKLGKFITPELLLNDDDLVVCSCDDWISYNISNPCGKNSLKLNNNSYINITTESPTTGGFTKPTITERPVYDALQLQPLYLSENYNKQIWVTVNSPAGTVAGTYQGTISILENDTVLQVIHLSVEILPITLLAPAIEYSIYYRSRLMNTGTISSEDKNLEQYEAELINMVKHGITNPSCYQVPSDALLSQVLALRHQYFPNATDLYVFGRTIKNITVSDISNLKTVGSVNGFTSVYIYGIDESNMDTPEYRAQIQTVHDNGAFVYCAQSSTNALAVKDVLDVAIGSSGFTADQIDEFQATAHKIFSYGNPQTVIEYPLTFRRNYGLFLWQLGYDGCMPYALMHSMQDGWSDFDDELYRDHMMVYPTANGVINTVQWEGFREGVNDMRYLATLQAAIIANPGAIATSATNWLTTLKTTDLTTVDLDTIRAQMVTYILQLQEA
jgi:hypothetical protein